MNVPDAAFPLQVQPAAFGIGIAKGGRKVSKVTVGSQAERFGVAAGWTVSTINGVAMPNDASGSKAISEALAAGALASGEAPCHTPGLFEPTRDDETCIGGCCEQGACVCWNERHRGPLCEGTTVEQQVCALLRRFITL